jgi:hypothetical protein
VLLVTQPDGLGREATRASGRPRVRTIGAAVDGSADPSGDDRSASPVEVEGASGLVSSA